MQNPVSQRAEGSALDRAWSRGPSAPNEGSFGRQLPKISVRYIIDEAGRLAVSAPHPIRDWRNAIIGQRCMVHEEEHEMYTVCAKYEPCILSFGYIRHLRTAQSMAVISSSLRRNDSPMMIRMIVMLLCLLRV